MSKRGMAGLIASVILISILFAMLMSTRERNPKDFEYWVWSGFSQNWSAEAAQGNPEAQFHMGAGLLRTNYIITVVSPLGNLPIVKTWFQKTTYSLSDGIDPQQLRKSYEWIKKSADQGFAPAVETAKLFNGRIGTALQESRPTTNPNR